ncbi:MULTISPECIES: hypothetical protein [Spiribacter]|mgnify:CR=1 FL=1|jgi:FtsH-binding integral membrane protein|uniref:Uncharacterized protein n=2 Tax=Spiribacter TaxID=1335745 RepID=A0A557RLY2_9GAMM|nr:MULTISPECIES: hypothetical protein [Spiribacter]PYZ99503.1 hypothetical protein A6K26_008740 [Gammaproteobacteria bacterium 2W06]AUB79035.1 hypothetical protein BBH56_07970 [Spiribacter roseus]KAF0279220.1 hypothetical protein BA897_00465 [Spiribacter roseus]KAF0281758.1 hypothetical protein BA900_02630 [Spiribacter roseus]KAF0284567.1 hypothetical protein BA898_09680 [Spiribacter roseus]
MNDLPRLLRTLGWVFLALALNIVVIGIGALWMKIGPATIGLLLDPGNAVIWLTTALTFAPAVGSFYAARLMRRRDASR